jgi:hypothetical protein
MRTPRTPAFEAGMALGLGKELVFVVPKEIVESDELSFDISKGNVLFKSTPAATARELIGRFPQLLNRKF